MEGLLYGKKKFIKQWDRRCRKYCDRDLYSRDRNRVRVLLIVNGARLLKHKGKLIF